MKAVRPQKFAQITTTGFEQIIRPLDNLLFFDDYRKVKKNVYL